MKLDAKRFALAAAAATGLVWLVAALVMMALSGAMMGGAGHMIEGMGPMGWTSALVGIAVGAATAALLTGLTAWLTATFYNRLL